MSANKEQIRAAIEIVRLLADTIRQLKRVPSGELYAHVMGSMDLATYERVIQTLKNTGLVAESSHMLEWRGPSIHEEARQNSLL